MSLVIRYACILYRTLLQSWEAACDMHGHLYSTSILILLLYLVYGIQTMSISRNMSSSV